MELHIGSNYDYHFNIRELAEEFKGHFQCLEENRKVHIKKEYENGKTVIYKIKSISSVKRCDKLLSNLYRKKNYVIHIKALNKQ